MELVVTFAEKPATRDERQIAKLLTRIARAINSRDLPLLKSVYATEAMVQMSVGSREMFTVPEYLERLSHLIPDVRSLRLSDVVIRLDGMEASVFCTSILHFHGTAGKRSNSRLFKCRRLGGRWEIVEAVFLDGQ